MNADGSDMGNPELSEGYHSRSSRFAMLVLQRYRILGTRDSPVFYGDLAVGPARRATTSIPNPCDHLYVLVLNPPQALPRLAPGGLGVFEAVPGYRPSAVAFPKPRVSSRARLRWMPRIPPAKGLYAQYGILFTYHEWGVTLS